MAMSDDERYAPQRTEPLTSLTDALQGSSFCPGQSRSVRILLTSVLRSSGVSSARRRRRSGAQAYRTWSRGSADQPSRAHRSLARVRSEPFPGSLSRRDVPTPMPMSASRPWSIDEMTLPSTASGERGQPHVPALPAGWVSIAHPLRTR